MKQAFRAFYAAISECCLPNRIDVFSSQLSAVISAMTYALELPGRTLVLESSERRDSIVRVILITYYLQNAKLTLRFFGFPSVLGLTKTSRPMRLLSVPSTSLRILNRPVVLRQLLHLVGPLKALLISIIKIIPRCFCISAISQPSS